MSDKRLAIQQLDEQLTAAGHDPECAAYEPGNPCSGPPVCGGTAVVLPELYGTRPAKGPIVGLAEFLPASDTEVLTGAAAAAHRRYKAASVAYQAARAAMTSAEAEWKRALDEYTTEITR